MKQVTTEQFEGVKMLRVNTDNGKKRTTRTKYFVDGKEVHGHNRWKAEQFLEENFDEVIRTNEVDWNA